MERSIPLRVILAMPASSRAIQSGVALSTVTDALPIDDRMGEKKTRGQSSGCSFALHKAVAVASRMDKSLSFSLSKITSKRFRIALFWYLFFWKYVWVDRHIEYHSDICQKVRGLGVSLPVRLLGDVVAKYQVFPLISPVLSSGLHEKF